MIGGRIKLVDATGTLSMPSQPVFRLTRSNGKLVDLDPGRSGASEHIPIGVG